MSVVMLTGGSGFLGGHVLDLLLQRGHRVRALVRSPTKLRETLSALNLDVADPRVEVIAGDMTDPDAVAVAARGAELAIHAAATYSYRRRDAERMLQQNRLGTSTVVGAAIEAGCRGIVHVSSIVALLRPGVTVDHESPLGTTLGPYTQSKVESERVARDLQEDGAPVAVVNPGGIIGPQDPYLGETNEIVRDILRGRLPTWPKGRLQWVDVRDTAEVVVAALDRPGRRYLVPGTARGVAARGAPGGDRTTSPRDQAAAVGGSPGAQAGLPHRVVVPAVRRGGRAGGRSGHQRRLLGHGR